MKEQKVTEEKKREGKSERPSITQTALNNFHSIKGKGCFSASQVNQLDRLISE